jgi:uroporphyrinogen-III synthase
VSVEEIAPLAGFTVAVTAERRREEIAALLHRRGARVVTGSAISIVPLADDQALHAATAECIALAPDLVVATTGFGFRGWLEAAEGWGLGDALRSALQAARLVARGPKPCGAIRAAGLTEEWAAQTESCDEILSRLLAGGVAGRRIAVQEHGEPQVEFTAALRAAGATVVDVPVYRWILPADTAPARRLVEQLVTGQIDAVTFTSASTVKNFARIFGEEQAADLLSTTVVASIGPVTAEAAQQLDITTAVMPGQYTIPALVDALVAHFASHQPAGAAR